MQQQQKKEKKDTVNTKNIQFKIQKVTLVSDFFQL